MDLSTFTSKLGGILSTGLAGLLVDDDSQFIERRSYPRLKFRFTAVLEVNGQRFQARGTDLHRLGAGISSDLPLPLGALVFLHAKPYGLMGWAEVRWCAERGLSRYQIGLEFRSPLMRAEVGTWQFHYVPSTQAPEPSLHQLSPGEL